MICDNMINEADELFKASRYVEAAKLYIEIAEKSENLLEKKIFLKKAADSYHELGSFDEEAACIYKILSLSEGIEKVELLVKVWSIYILAIAGYQYETSFEWKGEVENLDEAYGEKINYYYSEAVKAIRLALEEKGVDKKWLLEALGNECVKRQNEGGWGADHCWNSIHSAWNKNSE